MPKKMEDNYIYDDETLSNETLLNHSRQKASKKDCKKTIIALVNGVN